MSTVTLVVIGIWNGLLLALLLAVFLMRTRVARWVTGADDEDRTEWERQAEWEDFLTRHPELEDVESGVDQ
jgi:hypothetical protein